jgi:hypothetical protein
MFNSYKKILYNFDGIERTILDFNIDIDFSDIENSFYSQTLDTDLLLDTFSLKTFDSSSLYYIPFYTSNIVNPFLELPPSTEQIETEYNEFKALMSPSANFTATGGQTAAFVEAGDLVVRYSPSYEAGFDTTDNFAYIADVDYELNKLKVLNKGMTAPSGYRIIRKTGNQWNPITNPLLTGFVLNNVFLENFSNSPTSFVNENGISIKDFNIAGFTSGTPTGGYITVSELSDFIGTKNIINIPTKSDIKPVRNIINGSS